MALIDLIFGKKKTIKHPTLGVFQSERIKGNNQTKHYTWYGKLNLDNKAPETTVILEGNNAGPFTNHLNFISQLKVHWLSKYLPEIDKKITEKGIDKGEEYANWKKTFYLSAIYAANDKSPEFELTLDPLDKQKINSIGIVFKNNIISEIEKYD